MVTESSRRQSRIYEILRYRGSIITTRELARILGVTTRTINTDLATLREAGIEIESSLGRSGGVILAGNKSPGSMAQKPIGSSIIGYSEELQQLLATLYTVESGNPAVAWLTGPPGIGKTTLVREVAAFASVRNMSVHIGWCTEQEGSPPYWPWIQTCRSVIEALGVRNLSVRGSIDWAALAHLGIQPPHTEVAVPPRELSSPFELYSAVGDLVRLESGDQAKLVIVENIHWADPASVELLRYFLDMLSDQPLGLIVTSRESDPGVGQRTGFGSQIVDQVKIKLSGLSNQESVEFLTVATDESVTQEVLQQVIPLAEGNPLFLKEFARALNNANRLRPSRNSPARNNTIDVPKTVQEMVRSRVDELHSECRSVLEAGSILGREFGIDLLRVLIPEYSVEDALSLLDIAKEAGVLEQVQGRPGRYRFVHALTRQAMRSALNDGNRIEMHAAIVKAFQVEAKRFGERTTELAYHAYEALPILGADVVLQYLYEAGEKALATLAYDDALAVLTRAEKLVEDQAPSKIKGDVYFALGRAQVAFEQLEPSIESMVTAFDTFLAAGENESAVAMATHPYPWGSFTWLELIERAIPLAVPDSIELGWMLSRRALLSTSLLGDAEQGQHDFVRALEIAERHDSKPLRIWTYARRVSQQMTLFRSGEALDYGRRVMGLSAFMEDKAALAHALFWSGHAAICEGYSEEADQYANTYLDLAQSLQHKFLVVQAVDLRRKLSHALGMWDDALNQTDYLANELGPDSKGLIDDSNLALLLFEKGDPVGGEEALRSALDGIRQVSWHGDRGLRRRSGPLTLVIARIAAISESPEHLSMLRSAIASFPRVDTDAAINTSSSVLMRIAGGLDAAARGDGDIANRNMEKLKTLEVEGLRILSGEFQPPMSFHRALGKMAVATEDLELATSYFEQAVKFLEKARYLPELAHTLYDYSSVPLQKGDRYAASKLIDQGLQICDQVGMVALGRLLRQQQSKAHGSGKPVYPAGLSKREVDVLRLVVEGLTNRQISESLHLAPSTVATHIRNILRKTGAANRAESVTYAHRVQLL